MGRSFALVLGFEYLFKVASYVDSARTGRRSRTLGDALEFLVVNPVLVYAERGERSVELPSVTAAGARWLAGAATLYVHFIGTAAVPDALQVYRLSLLRYGVATAASLGAGVTWLQLVFWYLGHSGTASLQIAGMRALGVPLPERYRAPFLARTPEDFWRRWNTYLGSWLMRYVFMPAGAFLLRRRTQRGGGKAEKAIAVVFTFGACGLAHELVKVVEFGRLSGGALVGFLFGGLVLIGWKGAELLVRSRRGAPSRDGVWSAVRAGAARLAMVCLVAMMGLAFLPGLSGVPLHQQLRLLLTGW
jgi:hypothetical protein